MPAPSIRGPILRGLGYALTSALILLAGLFVNLPADGGYAIAWEYLWLAAGLLSCSLPFFHIYACVYTYGEQQEWSENRIVFVMVCLLSGVGAAASFREFYITGTAEFPSYASIVLAQLAMAMLLTVYYYRNRRGNMLTQLVRYRITVPILYSIGMHFLFTFSVRGIAEGHGWVTVLLPYILFGVYTLVVFFWGERLKKGMFGWVNVAALLVIALMVAVFPKPLATAMKNMVVSAAFAAFIAAFEAWRVTEYRVSPTANPRQPDSLRRDTYYHATALASCLSLLALPVLLIFTDYFHVLFYILASVIGTAACITWFLHGIFDCSWLRKYCPRVKTAVGFALLVIVVADAVTKLPLPAFLAGFDDFFQFSTLFVVIGIFYYLFGALMKDYMTCKADIMAQPAELAGKNSRGKAWYIISQQMVHQPKNFNRLLGIGSFIPFVVIFLTDVLGVAGQSRDTILRMRLTEVIYIGISLVCIVVDVIQKMLDFQDDTEKEPPQDDQQQSAPMLSARIWGFLKLTRIFTCLAIEVIVFVPCVVKTGRLFHSLALGLPFMLSAMTGFAINDICDYRKDKINKSHRALVSGLLTVKQAKRITLFLGLLSYGTAVHMADSVTGLCLYLLALLGVLVYNGVVKYAAVAKTACAALICALPVLFTALAVGKLQLAVFLALCAFLYILGRETRMDILDFDGDAADGIRTLPILAGKKAAAYLAMGVIILSLTLSCGAIFIAFPVNTGMILCGLVLSAQFACELLWRNKKRGVQRKSILLQWVPMLITFFAAVFM